MKKILIFSEVKQRELHASALLKLKLQKKGYKVKIVNFLDSPMLQIWYHKPDVIINNGMRSDHNFIRLFYYPKTKFNSKIITIYAEQITSNINKEGFYNNDKILVNTDAHISWGEGFAEILKRKSSVNNEKIYVTGSHRLDILSLFDESHCKSKFSQLYNLNKEKKWILIAGNIVLERKNTSDRYEKYLEKSQSEFTNNIIKLANELPNVEFIFRSHPSISEKQYNDEMNLYQEYSNIKYTNTHSISEWLLAIEGVVTWQSTSSIEAWALGKPVIAYIPIRENKEYDAWQIQYMTLATNYPTLKNLVEEIIDNSFCESREIIDKRNHYLEKWYYKLDFKAYNRITEVVDKVVNDDSKPIEYMNNKKIEKEIAIIWRNELRNYLASRVKRILKKPRQSYITKREIKSTEIEIYNTLSRKDLKRL